MIITSSRRPALLGNSQPGNCFSSPCCCQIEQKIASIPYSFAEFAAPTVASAGDAEVDDGKEKNDDEAAGKERKNGEEVEGNPKKDEEMRDEREPSRSDKKRSRGEATAGVVLLRMEKFQSSVLNLGS